MFERFTDQARRTIVLAQNDAREFGHAGIHPAHILLALCEEGTGAASRAMTSIGADPAGLRERVESAFDVTDERKHVERLPFSPKAKKVLELSMREALQLGHRHIGTEHLLLAILRWAGTENPRIDDLYGLPVKRLRDAALAAIQGPPHEARFTPALVRAMEAGQRAAGGDLATTGHLLAAMADDPHSQAARALSSLGVDRDAVARAVAEVPIDETSDAGAEIVIEVHVGSRRLRVSDPGLAARLSSVTTEQVLGALRRLADETGADPGLRA